MTHVRTVRYSAQSRPTTEGAGVQLRRAFGHGKETLFDPFLMLDDFRGDHPSRYAAGFPWHPHRGIETITYVIAGEVDHADSIGNSGTIGPGDVQWMTAGSGIIHQEMPRGDAQGRMGGFQLWANLPARDKMIDPRYAGIAATAIPTVETTGARVRVICGRVDGTAGPVTDIAIEPEYLDVALEPGATWTHPTPPEHTAFAYLFEGAAAFGPPPGSPDVDDVPAGSDAPSDGRLTTAGQGTVILLTDGELASATAGAAGARFLFVSGRPLREPIAWGGPIVMNTNAELNLAFRELEQGTFVKVGGK